MIKLLRVTTFNAFYVILFVCNRVQA